MDKRTNISLSLLTVLIQLSCQKAKVDKQDTTNSTRGFEKLTSQQTNIDFTNTIEEAESFNFLYYQYLYNGGGVAVGDINNDGLQDLYFVGNTTPDKFYLNKGDFVFEDITSKAGITRQGGFKTGVNMIDINKDGYLDIYVCRSVVQEVDKRKNLLYINNGDNTFTEKAEAYGLDDAGYSVQAYFLDADKDNTYEVYVLNHPKDMNNANNIRVKQREDGSYASERLDDYSYISDRYYRMKDGKYQDVSATAGILDDAYGLSAVIADFNEDHLPDIYVANDYIKPDRLWINQGNHRFKDELDQYFKHTSFSSMGSDYADLNNDDKPDLLVLDMLAATPERRHQLNHLTNVKKFKDMQRFGLGAQLSRNVLQINQQPAPFSDIAFMDGIAQTDWSWSVLMADFDNDALKDIHITNGYYRNMTNLDYMDFKINDLQAKYRKGQISLMEWLKEIPSEPTRNFFFKNEGHLEFADYSDQWNAQTGFSNGAVYADLNNDGWLDVVVNNINGQAHILKNNKFENAHNFLSLNFKGDGNTLLLGTKVKCFTSNNQVLTEIYNPQRGFLSSVQHRLHFGLGKAKVDSLQVFWPDTSTQTIKHPKVNNILSIEKSASSLALPSQKNRPSLFKEVQIPFKKHQENKSYSEFDHERLIDRSYSDLGPDALCFDVNKDGREDVFISGGSEQPTQLYQQMSDGKFKATKHLAFETDKRFEDTALASIDANQDGYLDLLIGSASNEYELTSAHYPLRLYLFKPDSQTYERADFPETAISTTRILVADFDLDGLDDVFVAGRNYPKKYPKSPKSLVFQQTSNGFIDKTEKWLSDPKLGMLTDAVFEDINNDRIKELIVVGEWMPPKIFQFNNGFKDISPDVGFENLTGLWESIHTADVNNDGLKDILLGNRGLNTIYKASPAQALKMVVGDFDENSKEEYVMFQPNQEGHYKPLLGYKRIASQWPALRKKYSSYQAFADANWENFLKNSAYQSLEVKKLQHVILLNQGENNFETMDWPHFAQNSIGKAIVSLQFEGKTHVILAGNHFDTDAEFTVYDASNGHVMTWDSAEDQLSLIPIHQSGFMASGDVRTLTKITLNGKAGVLVLNNNQTPQVFLVNYLITTF